LYLSDPEEEYGFKEGENDLFWRESDKCDFGVLDEYELGDNRSL
jgi:hypothetical protein